MGMRKKEEDEYKALFTETSIFLCTTLIPVSVAFYYIRAIVWPLIIGIICMMIGMKVEPSSIAFFSMQKMLEGLGVTYTTFGMAIIATIILSLTGLVLFIPISRAMWDYLVRVRGK